MTSPARVPPKIDNPFSYIISELSPFADLPLRPEEMTKIQAIVKKWSEETSKTKECNEFIVRLRQHLDFFAQLNPPPLFPKELVCTLISSHLLVRLYQALLTQGDQLKYIF